MLICRALATGASPPAVEKLMLIFPDSFAPGLELEKPPGKWLINKYRTTMKVMAEVCCTIIAARKKRWVELCQDGTTVDKTKLQDIVLTVPDGDDGYLVVG